MPNPISRIQNNCTFNSICLLNLLRLTNYTRPIKCVKSVENKWGCCSASACINVLITGYMHTKQLLKRAEILLPPWCCSESASTHRNKSTRDGKQAAECQTAAALKAASSWSSRGQCQPGKAQHSPTVEDEHMEPLPAHYTHNGNHMFSLFLSGSSANVTLN